MMRFQRTGAWANLRKWFADSEKNTKSFIENAQRDSAENVLKSVKAALTGDDELVKEYRDSLEVVRVRGSGECAIKSRPKARRVGKLDPSRNVLYFKVRKLAVGSSLAKRIETESPFVIGVLRKVPRELSISYRRIGPDEMKRTRAKNSVVARDLNKRVAATDDRDLRLVEFVTPDMEFMAIRLEKGFGGESPMPHWGPAVSGLAIERVLKKETVDIIGNLDGEKKVRIVDIVDRESIGDLLAEKVLQRYTKEVRDGV